MMDRESEFSMLKSALKEADEKEYKTFAQHYNAMSEARRNEEKMEDLERRIKEAEGLAFNPIETVESLRAEIMRLEQQIALERLKRDRDNLRSELAELRSRPEYPTLKGPGLGHSGPWGKR